MLNLFQHLLNQYTEPEILANRDVGVQDDSKQEFEIFLALKAIFQSHSSLITSLINSLLLDRGVSVGTVNNI